MTIKDVEWNAIKRALRKINDTHKDFIILDRGDHIIIIWILQSEWWGPEIYTISRYIFRDNVSYVRRLCDGRVRFKQDNASYYYDKHNLKVRYKYFE